MSKVFKAIFTFSVPEDTEPEVFMQSLADSVDEMLGDRRISYHFGFFFPEDDKEEQDEEK